MIQKLLLAEHQAHQERLPGGMIWETGWGERREQSDPREQEAQPFALKRKSEMVSDMGLWSLQVAWKVRTAGLSPADLHRAREKQTTSFTLLCKDAAGESMGRGGDNVQVAVVPKDKKDRFVPHGPVVGNKR